MSVTRAISDGPFYLVPNILPRTCFHAANDVKPRRFKEFVFLSYTKRTEK